MSALDPGPMLAAPGRERPDYTVFQFPAASLVDGAAEEIEVDQALSLAGRRGRDFLGVGVIQGLLDQMLEETLTVVAADHSQQISFRMATRTGQFQPRDPELMWYWDVDSTFNFIQTTAVGEHLNTFDPVHEGGNHMLGEPFLYVAPRVFWRVQNDLDQTLAINDLSVRWGTIPVRLTFFTFIELLERFADVQLL